MYQRLTGLLLKCLRVPPEPHPPHGDPSSLRVFRAGRHFLNLRLLKWGFAQVGAMVGILFWFGVFSDLEVKVEERRARAAQPKPVAGAPAAPVPVNVGETISNSAKDLAAEVEKEKQEYRKTKKPWRPINSFHAWQHGTASFLAHLPRPAMLVIWFFEVAGFVLYVLQLPVTFLLARMDYDLRWYMVTDRSLRIRHGLWKVHESTMSFANIQQVVVSQGPLQRFLGLSDVRVQSAGGGNEDKDEKDDGDDMHHGLFHSVTNPTEIRDLILERLRRFRESGLGDPEEKSAPLPVGVTGPSSGYALTAARELLIEARALRATLN